MGTETKESPPAVRLTVAEEARHTDQLTLRYEFVNSGSERVYLFSPPVEFGLRAGVVAVKQGAWVFQDGDHGVRLVSAVLRPPGWLSTAARLPVVVTAVQAHSTHVGRIVLALPMVESHPYLPSSGDPNDALFSISQARVQFGWVPMRSGVHPVALQLSGGESVEELTGSWGMPLQYVAEALVPLSKVALRRHPDPFDRPMPAQ